MANLTLARQTKPVSERQVARIISRGLVEINCLPASQADEAMSLDGLPALQLDVADPTAPNGTRTFLITVEDVS
jgi:hypothetical protein